MLGRVVSELAGHKETEEPPETRGPSPSASAEAMASALDQTSRQPDSSEAGEPLETGDDVRKVDWRTMKQLADAAHRLGRYEEAKGGYKRALQLMQVQRAPQSKIVAVRQLLEMTEVWERCTRWFPEPNAIPFFVAFRHLLEGRRADAIPHLRQCAKLDPKSSYGRQAGRMLEGLRE